MPDTLPGSDGTFRVRSQETGAGFRDITKWPTKSGSNTVLWGGMWDETVWLR